MYRCIYSYWSKVADSLQRACLHTGFVACHESWCHGPGPEKSQALLPICSADQGGAKRCEAQTWGPGAPQRWQWRNKDICGFIILAKKNINNRQSLDNPHIWDISTSTSVKYLQIAILGIPHFLLANSNKYRTFLLLIYPKSIWKLETHALPHSIFRHTLKTFRPFPDFMCLYIYVILFMLKLWLFIGGPPKKVFGITKKWYLPMNKLGV